MDSDSPDAAMGNIKVVKTGGRPALQRKLREAASNRGRCAGALMRQSKVPGGCHNSNSLYPRTLLLIIAEKGLAAVETLENSQLSLANSRLQRPRRSYKSQAWAREVAPAAPRIAV